MPPEDSPNHPLKVLDPGLDRQQIALHRGPDLVELVNQRVASVLEHRVGRRHFELRLEVDHRTVLLRFDHLRIVLSGDRLHLEDFGQP